MLLAFVVLGLVSSVPIQEIGWEEHLHQNHIFCVERDIKPSINQSVTVLGTNLMLNLPPSPPINSI